MLTIASADVENPTRIRVIERTLKRISFAFIDPGDEDDKELLDVLLMSGKPFSITLDGEHIFVTIIAVDGALVDLQIVHTTEAKMALRPS